MALNVMLRNSDITLLFSASGVVWVFLSTLCTCIYSSSDSFWNGNCLPSLKSLRGSSCLETGIYSRITNNTTSCKNYMHMIDKSQISMWVRKKWEEVEHLHVVGGGVIWYNYFGKRGWHVFINIYFCTWSYNPTPRYLSKRCKNIYVQSSLFTTSKDLKWSKYSTTSEWINKFW